MLFFFIKKFYVEELISTFLNWISTHVFHLSPAKFSSANIRIKPDFHPHLSPIADATFVKEKYLGRKINLQFLWSSIILVLRLYWGISSLRPDKAVGRPFCKNFLIFVKCPRDSRKMSDWFRCKKISQKLKYLNFKSLISTPTFRLSPAKLFALDMRKSVKQMESDEKIAFALFTLEVQIFQLLRNFLAAKPIRFLS